MLRSLYSCLLRLHPSAFRDRFGDEMLSIFDQTGRRIAQLSLVLEGALSLTRQWALRREFWRSHSVAAPQPVSHLPSFTTLESFRPSTAAVVHGLALSVMLFCATCFAIRYSWIRVLHIQIPEFQSEGLLPTSPLPPTTQTRSIQKPIGAANSPKEQQSISDQLSVDVLPVEGKTEGMSKSGLTLKSQISGAQPEVKAVLFEISLDNYAGTYKAQSPGIMIKVAIEGGHLTMQFAGGRRRALSPKSETTFGIPGEPDGQVEFVPGADGKMRQVSLYENGQHVIAERQ